MTPLNCIACNKKLETAIPPEAADHNQPYGATIFTARGQFGSTIFDPMNGTYLEINVCDDCLHKAAVQNQVLLCGTPQPRKRVMKFWDPEEDDEY